MATQQTFQEFAAKELLNAVYWTAGFFTMVTSLCEYADGDEEEQIIRKKGAPSQELVKKETEGPKGLFALSFSKIPCDLPIKPCQYRTGRRYIQADNFPADDDLDHYLGLMNQVSNVNLIVPFSTSSNESIDTLVLPEQMHKLTTNDSTLSFDFASEDDLEFQLQCERMSELFPQLDSTMLKALSSYFPHHVEYLQDQDLDGAIVQEYFTSPNGEEDLSSLSEMLFYVRALVEDADLATKVPVPSPQDYKEFMFNLNAQDEADMLPLVPEC
eukprot:UN26032